jgi:hypothetical protein
MSQATANLSLRKQLDRIAYGAEIASVAFATGDDFWIKVDAAEDMAYENIVKAGIKDQYECGILARIQGWIDARGLGHELTPPLGKCMKVLGGECCYTVTLQFP